MLNRLFGSAAEAPEQKYPTVAAGNQQAPALPETTAPKEQAQVTPAQDVVKAAEPAKEEKAASPVKKKIRDEDTALMPMITAENARDYREPTLTRHARHVHFKPTPTVVKKVDERVHGNRPILR